MRAPTLLELTNACTDGELGSLNDAAVNTLRECTKAGDLTTDLGGLIRSETYRIGDMTGPEYLALSRAGAVYPLTRRQRVQVYIVVATRKAFAR